MFELSGPVVVAARAESILGAKSPDIVSTQPKGIVYAHDDSNRRDYRELGFTPDKSETLGKRHLSTLFEALPSLGHSLANSAERSQLSLRYEWQTKTIFMVVFGVLKTKSTTSAN